MVHPYHFFCKKYDNIYFSATFHLLQWKLAWTVKKCGWWLFNTLTNLDFKHFSPGDISEFRYVWGRKGGAHYIMDTGKRGQLPHPEFWNYLILWILMLKKNRNYLSTSGTINFALTEGRTKKFRSRGICSTEALMQHEFLIVLIIFCFCLENLSPLTKKKCINWLIPFIC